MGSLKGALRRRWRLVLLAVVLVLVLPLAVLAGRPDRYRAEGTLAVPRNEVLAGAVGVDGDRGRQAPAAQVADLAAGLVGSPGFLARVAPDAAGATVAREGDIVRISVDAGTRAGATGAAGAVTAAVLAEHRDRVEASAEEAVDVLQGAVARLEGRQAAPAEVARARSDLDQARALADLATAEAAAARVLDRSAAASRVDAPPLLALGLLLVVLAAALAAGLVVVAERRDRTVRDELDVTDTTGRPVLAVVEGR